MTGIKRQQSFNEMANYSQVQQGAFLDLKIKAYENQHIEYFDGKSNEKNEKNISIKEVVEEVVGKENYYISKMEKEDIISQITEEIEKYHSDINR